MSDDENNNNNKDDETINNKNPSNRGEINDISLNKFFLPPIDCSKNRLFRTWKINPVLNRNLLLLDNCKEKNFKLSKTSKEIINEKKLNTNTKVN